MIDPKKRINTIILSKLKEFSPTKNSKTGINEFFILHDPLTQEVRVTGTDKKHKEIWKVSLSNALLMDTDDLEAAIGDAMDKAWWQYISNSK